MIPPSKQHLMALAGWAIAKRSNCSDQQHLALCHFQEGCGGLAEVIDDLAPAPPSVPPPVRTPHRPAEIPAPVRECLRIPQDGVCAHKFSIHNQLCLYCGVSYRKAHGRVPELM